MMTSTTLNAFLFVGTLFHNATALRGKSQQRVLLEYAPPSTSVDYGCMVDNQWAEDFAASHDDVQWAEETVGSETIHALICEGDTCQGKLIHGNCRRVYCKGDFSCLATTITTFLNDSDEELVEVFCQGDGSCSDDLTSIDSEAVTCEGVR